jgi:hypothetical protein
VDIVGDAWRGSVDVDDMEKLIAKASDVSWTRGSTDGVGSAFEFHRGTLHGSALLYKEMVIHSDLFVAEVQPLRRGEIQPRNQLNSPPPNLDHRREQHTR